MRLFILTAFLCLSIISAQTSGPDPTVGPPPGKGRRGRLGGMGRMGEKGRSCKIRNEKMEAMKAVKQMKKMAEMEMKNMMPRQVTWEMCKTASEPFTVALVAGQNSTYGRVQINYKGEWGTVCDDGFTDMEAKAVCKSAGMYGGRVMSDSEITPQMRLSASDQTKIWLDDVRCHEGTYLKQCCFNEFGVHNCSHDNDVFVACQPVPPFCGWLVNHTMMFMEFDMNRDMGCASTDNDMDNMGNMGMGNMGMDNMGNMGMGNMGNMGMGNMGNMMGSMGMMGGMDPMMMKKHDNVEELGKKMMPVCKMGTPFGMALVGGANATMGRLEILYNQQWGTVCNNSFTDIEAMAVCRSLGFHGGKVWKNPPESLRVTDRSKPIWTGGLRCKKEAYFHQCCKNGWGATNCQHSQDVFIMCDPWPRECYKIRKEHEEKMKQKEQHEKAAECLGMSPEELEMMMMKKMEDNRKEEGMGMGGMGGMEGMGGEKEMMMKMFEKLMMGMMGKDDMGGMGGIGGMGNIGCNKDKMKMKMMEMFMDMMGGKEGKGGMRDMGGCRYGGMGGDRYGGMGMCGMCGMGIGGTNPMIQYQNLMMMMQKMLQRMNGMGGGATPSDGPPMSTVSPTSDGPPMSTDSPRSDEEDDEDDDDDDDDDGDDGGNSHGRKRSSTPQMSTVPTPRSSNA